MIAGGGMPIQPMNGALLAAGADDVAPCCCSSSCSPSKKPAPFINYVGSGQGTYATEAKYKFVGDGLGDFSAEKPPEQEGGGCCGACCPPGPWCQYSCGVCVGLLIFLFGYIRLVAGIYMKPGDPSQTAGLVSKYGQSNVGWWNMPYMQPTPIMDDLHRQLTPLPWEEGTDQSMTWVRRGMGPATQVADMMYNATKVPGVTEKIPEKLRGVFWMKGNGVGEELVSLQYSQWFEDEQTLVMPYAPWMWAWAHGVPKDAPAGGMMYGEAYAKKGGIASLVLPGLAISYKFSDTCKNSYCYDDGSGLKEAYMQTGGMGSLSTATELGAMVDTMFGLPKGTVAGAFTLQEMEGSVDGSLWKRTCNWGLKALSQRAFVEFGSYDLVKIIDGEGRHLEPQYSEFIQYMGAVPVMAWTGWDSEQTRDAVRGNYANLAAKPP